MSELLHNESECTAADFTEVYQWRRQLLRTIAQGNLQTAVDAETLLDEDTNNIPLFGWSEEQYDSAMQVRDMYLNWVEYQTFDNSSSGALKDADTAEDIIDVLADLEEDDALIMLCLFGLRDGRRWSYGEVARYLNLSVRDIVQREAAILDQLWVDSGAGRTFQTISL